MNRLLPRSLITRVYVHMIEATWAEASVGTPNHALKGPGPEFITVAVKSDDPDPITLVGRPLHIGESIGQCRLRAYRDPLRPSALSGLSGLRRE
jgi:hypothetical protein